MVRFTFIIPHYNLPAELLRRCLDSIPHRDDVQIIIVDDHSPNLYSSDGSIIESEVKKFPGNEDLFTEVLFLQKNVGPGVARNEAIKHALGEWLFFTDADDYYEKDALLELMTQCIDSNYDAIWFGYGDKNIYGNKINPIESKIISVPDAKKKELLRIVAPWNKAVRSSLLKKNNISFDTGYYCEDQFFSLRTLCECSNPGLYACNVYIHLSNEGSLSKTDDLSKLCCGFEIEMKYNRYLQKRNMLSIECRNFLLGGLLYRIYLQNRWLYRWYCIREFLAFGKDIAWSDYAISCTQRNIRPNLLYQITDPLIVFLGSVKQRLFKS